MLTVEEWIDALGKTESNSAPNAPLGDGGRAMGRWQVHPDWLWGWASHYGILPKLSETWDEFVRRILERFAYDHLGWLGDVRSAMYFHIGHIAKETDPSWDKDYAKRFSNFAGI
jgi:hypothetical protein